MSRKVVSEMMPTLLLIGMSTSAFKVQPVRTDGNIHIIPQAPLQVQPEILVVKKPLKPNSL